MFSGWSSLRRMGSSSTSCPACQPACVQPACVLDRVKSRRTNFEENGFGRPRQGRSVVVHAPHEVLLELLLGVRMRMLTLACGDFVERAFERISSLGAGLRCPA